MKNPRKFKKMWDRVIGPRECSYKHMDSDPDVLKSTWEKEVPTKPQCNLKSSCDAGNKDIKKEKKKRKGWKRFRHAALMSCRYLGMGVSHLSPVSTMYPVPDYNVDPVWWCNDLQGKRTPAPHWTMGLYMTGW